MNLEQLLEIKTALGAFSDPGVSMAEADLNITMSEGALIVSRKADGVLKSSLQCNLAGNVLTISTKANVGDDEVVRHVFTFNGVGEYVLQSYSRNGAAQDISAPDYDIGADEEGRQFSEILRQGKDIAVTKALAVTVERAQAREEERRANIFPALRGLADFMVQHGAAGRRFLEQPFSLYKIKGSNHFFFYIAPAAPAVGNEVYALLVDSTNQDQLEIRKVKYKEVDGTPQASRQRNVFARIDLQNIRSLESLSEDQLAFLEDAAGTRLEHMQHKLQEYQAHSEEQRRLEEERARGEGEELRSHFQKFVRDLKGSCDEMLRIIEADRSLPARSPLLKTVLEHQTGEIKKKYWGLLPGDLESLQLYRDQISGSVFYVTKDGSDNDVFNFLSDSNGNPQILSLNLSNNQFLVKDSLTGQSDFSFTNYGDRLEAFKRLAGQAGEGSSHPEDAPARIGSKSKGLFSVFRRHAQDRDPLLSAGGAGAGAGSGASASSGVPSVGESYHLNWDGFDVAFRKEEEDRILLRIYKYEDFVRDIDFLMSEDVVMEGVLQKKQYKAGEIGQEDGLYQMYKISNNLVIARKNNGSIKIFTCAEGDKKLMPTHGVESVITKESSGRLRFGSKPKKDLVEELFEVSKQKFDLINNIRIAAAALNNPGIIPSAGSNQRDLDVSSLISNTIFIFHAQGQKFELDGLTVSEERGGGLFSRSVTYYFNLKDSTDKSPLFFKNNKLWCYNKFGTEVELEGRPSNLLDQRIARIAAIINQKYDEILGKGTSVLKGVKLGVHSTPDVSEPVESGVGLPSGGVAGGGSPAAISAIPAAVPSLPPVTPPKIGNRQPLAPISGTGSNPFAPAVPVQAPITSSDGVYQKISGNRVPDNQGEPMRISFAPASEIRRAQRQPDLLSDDAAKDKKIKSAFSIVDVKGVALDNIVTKVDTIFKTINQSLLDAQNEVFVSDGYTDKSRLANPIFYMVMIAKHNDGISHLSNDQLLSQFNQIQTSFGEEQLTENDDFLNKLRSVSVKFQEKMKNSGFYSGNERFNEEDAQAVKEYGLRTKRVSDDALIKICGQENFDKMGQALAAVKAITPPSRSVRPNPLSRGGTFPLAGHASGARGGDIDLL